MVVVLTNAHSPIKEHENDKTSDFLVGNNHDALAQSKNEFVHPYRCLCLTGLTSAQYKVRRKYALGVHEIINPQKMSFSLTLTGATIRVFTRLHRQIYSS